MVIRIAEFDAKPAFHDDTELVAQFRSWMREQPGFRHGWHATDAQTGRGAGFNLGESALTACQPVAADFRQEELRDDHHYYCL